MADNANDNAFSFLDINRAEVPEMTTHPEGHEFEARIEAYRTGLSKKGEQYFMPVFEDPADPTIKSFSNYYGFGAPEDTQKQKNVKLNRFFAFCDAFGVDVSQGVNFDDFIGQTAWIIVGTEESDDYGTQNTLKSIVTKGKK